MPTIDELKKQVEEELEKKKLEGMLNDLKGGHTTQEKIEIKDVPVSEQTITKKQAASEVINNLTKEKAFHIVSIVGSLVVFGLTNINGLIGGATAVLLVGGIAYRVTIVTKLEQMLKQKYSL